MFTSALVTGGAGFIGSHLVEALLREGVRVRVLDNLSTGSTRNLADLDGDVELVEGDIRNRDTVTRACSGFDVVFHLAAFISVPGSVADPVTADAVNIGGTLNTLLAARDAGVRRLVLSSSAATYGEPDTVPTPETYLPRPGSPYGLEKLYGEHMARLFGDLYGLETVALRYFNVFGPRQNPDSEYAAVIPKFAQVLLRGESPTIYGDGGQTRDFLYAADVARANILAATAPGAVGYVINVASGRALSVLDLFGLMRSVVGADVEARHAQPRPGDVRHSCADVRLAESLLGFSATVPLEEGLGRTIEWLRGVA
ncbi:MAG: SDR family oxidoreductase [Armatimonadetes bacterium]|nr:SDR family oxidoreductase [Armatimonadota bacterium]